MMLVVVVFASKLVVVYVRYARREETNAEVANVVE